MAGRVALVTGGTGGIGTALCKRLAKAEYRVATNYRDEEKKQQLLNQAKAEGFSVLCVKGDVTDFNSCASMVKEIERQLGPIEILVNNAGITRDGTFRKMSFEQWDAVLTTNLDSVFNMTRHVIEGMLERGFGRIINISSINGQKGQFGQTNYSAAKAGIHGFTMALAQEVARKGITVNTISPGYIGTKMVRAVPEDVLNKIIAQIPVGRLGEPQEVAEVVAFVAADSSGFMTGANIDINGGQWMH
jgi:acetoacetyl-CoA reductase